MSQKKELAGQGPPLCHPRNYKKGLVARRSGLHIPPGIDRSVVHSNFVVYVRPRGTAADARITNHFAALDARTGNRRERRKMRVPRCDSKTMVDNHQAPISRMVLCGRDDSVRGRVNRRAIVAPPIHPTTEGAFPAEGIHALAKTIGN